MQNIPPELHAFRWRYAARASPTDGPEEGGVAKGPSGMTSGDCISACPVRQLPPLGEALGSPPGLLLVLVIRIPRSDLMGDACDRLGKMVGTMTGEHPTTPGRPVSPPYKPPVKRDGLCVGAGKVALIAPALGIAADPEYLCCNRGKGETRRDMDRRHSSCGQLALRLKPQIGPPGALARETRRSAKKHPLRRGRDSCGDKVQKDHHER